MIQEVNRRFFKMAVPVIKKDSGNELSGNCPVCGDRKGRLHIVHVQNGDYDYVRCFNGGCEFEAPTNMYKFLQFFPNLQDAYKRETLNKKIQDLKAGDLNYLLDINKKTQETKAPAAPKNDEQEIPLETLFGSCVDSKKCSEYLINRKIQPRDDWFFSEDSFFTWNEKTLYVKDYLIIPIYNRSMNYKGFYSRSILKKKFSTFLLPDAEKLWTNHPESSKIEIVTEGIFDALSSGFKYSAAMIGADISPSLRDKWLESDVIFAFDNDGTGIKKAEKYASMGYNVYVPPNLPEKDFNEMLKNGYSPKEIKQVIENNVFKGIAAISRLKMQSK